MSTAPRTLPQTRAAQAGLSLVELTVAMTVGLFILGGIGLTLTNTARARGDLDQSLQQIENARYAMQALGQDIRHAGYYGRYVSSLPVPAAMPDPCATDLAGLQAGMALPVQGYDAPVVVPAELAGCLTDANHVPGTDIVVVRRAYAAGALPTSAAAKGVVYLQTTAYPSGPRYVMGDGSDPSVFTLQQKSADGSGAAVPAGLLPYQVHIYFVSPCDVPAVANTCSSLADDGLPIPTLKRLELTTDGMGTRTLRSVSLVQGIQNLQLDYGIDPAVAGGSSDGSPKSYQSAPASAGDWANVVAVQINLLAVNTQPSRGHIDSKRYNLGLAGVVGPFSDAYKRHAVTATVRVNNVSGPREP